MSAIIVDRAEGGARRENAAGAVTGATLSTPAIAKPVLPNVVNWSAKDAFSRQVDTPDRSDPQVCVPLVAVFLFSRETVMSSVVIGAIK